MSGRWLHFLLIPSKLTEQQNRLNELEKAHLDILELESGKLERVSNERIRALETELKIANARNAGTTEVRNIEDKLAAERRRANAEQRGFYAKEIAELDENRAKLDQYRKSLVRLNELKAQGENKISWDVELNGNIETYKVDDAINIAQAKIDNYGRMVDIAVNLTTEKSDLDTADAVTAAKRQQEQKDTQKRS